MASIAKRPNGTYRPRYRDADGKEHAKHFKKKSDAQQWLDDETAKLVTGTWVDPRSGRMTLREYAEEWRASQVHRLNTAMAYETNLRRNIYPRLGDRPLASIRPGEIQAWIAWLTSDVDGHKPLAPRTIRVCHSLVSSIFKSAVRDRKIASNPAQGVRLPQVHKVRVEPLTAEQVHALTEAMPPRWRAAIILAAGTGLRQAELMGLTVDRIDFPRRQLLVDRQMLTLAGRGAFFAPPKTKASIRTIPMPTVVAEALAAHLAAYPPGQDRLLFTTDDGRPMWRSTFSSRVWRPAAAKAGLPAAATFHDCRHFYASLLIRHGESVKTVQARLGHASAAETLDTYSHLWPDSDDRTRAAVDAVLGGAADSVRTDQVC